MDRIRGCAGVAVLAAVLAMTGCSGGAGGASAAGASSPSSSAAASSSARSPCPDPVGRACLGQLTAGTYRTAEFQPRLTYTVADGWANDQDAPGDFLLLPPGGNLPGVDAGTSDFIGVYSSVAAPDGCTDGPASDVPRTVAGMMDWLRSDPAFAAPHPSAVTVGGLTGTVVDLRMAPGWTRACPYSNGQPVAPMMVGVGRSSLNHNVIPGQVTRLYLLQSGPDVLAIEVVDVEDAGHLDAYSGIVQQMSIAA
jgi:hypothetical protein